MNAQTRPKPWAFLLSTDHKAIGKQFLFLGLFMSLVGALTALLIRWQVGFPNKPLPLFGYITPDKYNAILTLHGTIMIFFVGVQILVAFPSNYLIPLQIGARDMAFPRLNRLSLWLTLAAALALTASIFVSGGPSAAGWTGYPPLSASSNFSGVKWGVVLWLSSLFILFAASTLGGINYFSTVAFLRAPGMTWLRIPMTTWMLLAANLSFFFSVGPLTAAAFLLLLDNLAGTGFFLPAKGGEPLLWEHLFWFFGHPEVYVVFFPALGIILDILAVFSRKPVFGYKLILGCTWAAVALSYMVWAHHMFQSGMNPHLAMPFSVMTIAISIPFAVILFCMYATLWGGSLRLEAPLLWGIGFLATFLIGGLTGIFLGSAPVDIYLHGTYFVVAHFHYTFFPAVFFGGFAGIYYWFPKMFGRTYDQGLAKLHFWLTLLFFNLTFWPMFFVGLGGMVRRIADPSFYSYLDKFRGTNEWISLCALLLVLSQLTFAWNFLHNLFKGPKAEANPYQANGLEWLTTSPPPHGNWEGALPIVSQGPYEYSLPGAEKDWQPQVVFKPGPPSSSDEVPSHRREGALRFAWLLFLSSESMVLFGFVSALLVFKSGMPAWPPVGQAAPSGILGLCATLSLLAAAVLTGLTASNPKLKGSQFLLGTAFLLGLVFLGLQIWEWSTLSGSGSGLYGNLFYTLTGVHGLHAVAGLVLLLSALLKPIHAEGPSGSWLKVVSYYWYWLAGFWLLFYGLLYF